MNRRATSTSPELNIVYETPSSLALPFSGRTLHPLQHQEAVFFCYLMISSMTLISDKKRLLLVPSDSVLASVIKYIFANSYCCNTTNNDNANYFFPSSSLIRKQFYAATTEYNNILCNLLLLWCIHFLINYYYSFFWHRRT